MNASKLSTSFALLVLCVATISVAQEKMQSGTGITQPPALQEEGQANAAPPMQKTETVGPAETAKPAFVGRLPRYYASVVDAAQREAIYEIQRSYQVRLEQLRQQLAALELAATQEIEQQLSQEQLERVQELRMAAAASRLTSLKE